MEAVGRKWRNRAALGLLAGLLPVGLARLASSPPAVSAAPPPSRPGASRPLVDFDRLYRLDHLVLEGDPHLELRPLGAVGAGPAGPPAVAEPPPGSFWILALTALYTLNLPARSW